MFARQPSTKVFGRLFSKSRVHLRSQAHRHFLCELSFVPFASKESGVTAYALQNRRKPRKKSRKVTYDEEMYLLHIYRFINTQGGAPLFFLKPEAQKEKFPKEKCRKESFAHCGERQWLRALDWRHLPVGASRLLCEHTSKQ